MRQRLTPRAVAFFFLVAMGVYGAHSQEWQQDFRSLGLLHLLVLSGSQVSSLANVLSWWWGGFMKWGLRLPAWTALRDGVTWVGLFLYVAACGWSPPLTRAFLLTSTELGGAWIFPRPLSWGRQQIVALGLHIALFPEHVGKVSFHLSWACYALLCLVTLCVGSGILATALLSMLAQVAVVFFLGADWNVAMWPLWILANIVMGKLFERAVSPLASFAVVCGLGLLVFPPTCRSWWVDSVWTPFLGRAYDGAARAVLVGLHALMYNFNI